MQPKINIFWFRRDLRLEDNAGLYHALKAGLPVLPLFIFDAEILEKLQDKEDRRVAFIHHALSVIQEQLVQWGSSLQVHYGRPADVFRKLLDQYQVGAVYTNHDYEPYAAQRDNLVAALLQEKDAAFHTFKDQVIFEKSEVVKDDGTPYSVYTPYAKKWKALLTEQHLQPFDTLAFHSNFYKQPPVRLPSLEEIGFLPAEHPQIIKGDQQVIRHYHETRDIPSVAGTTRLGIHLRFGTVSVRELAKRALELNATFLGELIWREFFMQLLWHHPRVAGNSYRPEYEAIEWRNNEEEFQKWCEGKTGYPIVDAGMRELNATGFMHNRVRMITASFLVKHLLIDWKWGEAYFAAKLLDFDLSSNNGNWQWVAGCGCDAAPYFRLFNPLTQTKRFDAQLNYIRKWVPELDSFSYPRPVVVHEAARERCLATYKKALSLRDVKV